MTVANDIQELLARANSLLGKSSPQVREGLQYAQPYRRVIYYSFLSEEGTGDLNYTKNWRHAYFPDNLRDKQNVLGLDSDWILHGHNEGQPCAAPFFCHQFGFWPNPANHPTFIQVFTMKWKDVYEK